MSSSNSGRCAFCGEQNFSNAPTLMPIAFGASSEDDRGTFTKLKPLRWRFPSNKSPRTKLMCTACTGKRRVPQNPESSDSSWPHDVRRSDRVHVRKPHQREEKDSNQQKSSGRAMRSEHLEPHDKARQPRRIQKMPQRAQEQRAMFWEQQPKRRDSQKDTREEPTSDGRRRRSTRTPESQQEGARRCNTYANHRVSKESANTIEIETQTPVTKHRVSVGASTRPRKSSGEQSEPRGSEPKGQRLSSTADILGMSRALELPSNYFEMSLSSPKFSAARPPEQDALECRQMKPSGPTEARQSRRRATTTVLQVELRKQDETEEERQRRRSASYARMLLRMQRHYDALQLNGSRACPATAPPRRSRPKRHVKSVAVCDVKDDPANFAIDLDYLRAYKDAR